MADEEMKKASAPEGPQLKEREKIENPSELLQGSLDGLNKFGGFQLLKGLIKGVENMDPRRKAVKNIFLSDAAYNEARKKLKNELDELCAQFGMNTSVAINIFARAVVRERRIPFEISASSDAGIRAFQSLRQQAAANGLQDLSLREINREIAKSRAGK